MSRMATAIVAFSVVGAIAGSLAAVRADPFEAVVDRSDRILLVAHGCGYSREAVVALQSHPPAASEDAVVVVYTDPQRLSDCDAAVAQIPWWAHLQRRTVGPDAYCKWLASSASRWLEQRDPDGGVPTAVRDGVVVAVGWPAVSVLWSQDLHK